MPQRMLETRPATDEDFEFAWRLYADIVRPAIEPRLTRGWDDAGERERFRGTWHVGSAHIITLDTEPIGWGAARISREKVEIDHFYLKREHRNKGYGTIILSELIRTWKREGKAVHTSMMNDNRALSLYSRLGFEFQHGDELVRNLISRP